GREKGLCVGVEVKGEGKMRGEEFVILVHEGIKRRGHYGVMMKYNVVKEENKMGKEGICGVEKVVKMNMIELDKEGNLGRDEWLTGM
ncbi:hypothetical protein, partial [Paenibacillus xylanexedens]|uniref:hypothetical protein n=1 Tax=Paenibacillus xylanexedens TaxID=528191 RepID=UPI00164257E8